MAIIRRIKVIRQAQQDAAAAAADPQAVQTLAAYHDSIFGSRGWGKLYLDLQSETVGGRRPVSTSSSDRRSGEHKTAQELATLATGTCVRALAPAPRERVCCCSQARWTACGVSGRRCNAERMLSVSVCVHTMLALADFTRRA